MPTPRHARAAAPLDQFSDLAQRQAIASRNLVNTDELSAWLQDLLASRFGSTAENANPPHPSSRQAACERWTLSVARKWMIRQGQIESHEPSGQALAQSPAWIQQAISNGKPPQRLSLLHSERETLAGVLDWMRSDQGPALSSDWSRISVEQAISSEKNWIDATAKAALKKDLEAADAAGTTLFTDSPALGPDGRAGWRWVQVHSPEALDREGALMRHCVGSYANDVALERKSIYSLRDPDNKPRLTLETQQGHIAQLKAFANQPCPPELFARVADFAKAFESLCKTKDWPLEVSSEAEAAGVLSLPGLGLAILGSPPPDELYARFSSELDANSPSPAQALPALATLGWTRLAQMTLHLASIELKNQALFNASKQGNLELVELLLSHCNPEANNSYALRCAAANGHFAIVELLIPHSDPHANDSQALTHAAANGHLAIARLLLPHYDPKAYGLQPLSQAARYGHLAIVELLLPHSKPKANDSQALALAAYNGHIAIVDFLLPHSNPRADNSYALTLAAKNGHLAIVERLLPFSPPDHQAQALKEAQKAHSIETAELIQSALAAHRVPAFNLGSLVQKLFNSRQRQSPPAPAVPKSTHNPFA
jgi:ankyrin repeat protein